MTGIRQLPVVERPSRSQFWSEIFVAKQPVLIRGLNIGKCVEEWDEDFLKEVIGERKVSVHVSNANSLDFLQKNFSYNFMTIKELIEKIQLSNSIGQTVSLSNYSLEDVAHPPASATDNHTTPTPITKFYYRALGRRPQKDTALLSDFPETLRCGFALPPELEFDDRENLLHSEVLRISSPGLQLWTHFDVPENFLCQIRGQKKVVLFPPEQVENLYVEGSSSPVANLTSMPDLSRYPRATEALKHAYQTEMIPGDILFLPALWLHAVLMCPEHNSKIRSGDVCVSLNVFFYRKELLDEGWIYDFKDIYGNKDPRSLGDALDSITSIVGKIGHLPSPHKEFYRMRIGKVLRRLLEE